MGSSEKRERGGGEALTASLIGSHVLGRVSVAPREHRGAWGETTAQTGLGGS